MTFNWNYPTTVWVGDNRINDLTQACVNLKINKPLLVTDKNLVNLTMIKNVTSEVKKNFNELNIFSNFLFLSYKILPEIFLLNISGRIYFLVG